MRGRLRPGAPRAARRLPPDPADLRAKQADPSCDIRRRGARGGAEPRRRVRAVDRPSEGCHSTATDRSWPSCRPPAVVATPPAPAALAELPPEPPSVADPLPHFPAPAVPGPPPAVATPPVAPSITTSSGQSQEDHVAEASGARRVGEGWPSQRTDGGNESTPPQVSAAESRGIFRSLQPGQRDRIRDRGRER